MNCHLLKSLSTVCAVMLMICSGQVVAEEDAFSLKKLLMPGEVIEGHAEYEKDCANCHETFRGQAQPKLCLDCHEEVALDIESAIGFHGHPSQIEIRDCKGCHSEHLGRQADIVNLDKDAFNHRQTDFELTGKHAAVACGSCHQADKKYREAPGSDAAQCFACHETADRHRGALGETCEDCHSTKGWDDTQYDHSKTQFPLVGRHKETQCNACHPDEKYRDTPSDCFSCHALSDVHIGGNGEQCANCHNESDWQEISFDHDKDTDFKLGGGHDNLACGSCHKGSDFDQKLSTTCVDCHKNDDEHNGRNGRLCDSCHVTSRWTKLIFEHDRDTDFSLLGKHSDLTCESCHRDLNKEPQLGSACIDCHKVDDVHKGQEGDQCGKCHNSFAWDDQVRFSHDLTRFPLVGMHAVASCEACHESKVFSDVQGGCVECHGEEDAHDGALGVECATCHNPNDWRLWLFDHNQQTDFKLDGGHTDLSCSECHVAPADDGKQSSACAACHLKDDTHYRRFGRACERCHVTESFKDVRFKDARIQ